MGQDTHDAFLLRIRQRLKAVEQEIEEHEALAATARAKAVAYREILGLAEPIAEDASDAAIKPGGTVDKAIKALQDAGTPLHLFDIVARIGMPLNNASKRRVSTQINAYYRQGRIFSRPKPNTFGLLEWDRQ